VRCSLYSSGKMRGRLGFQQESLGFPVESWDAMGKLCEDLVPNRHSPSQGKYHCQHFGYWSGNSRKDRFLSQGVCRNAKEILFGTLLLSDFGLVFRNWGIPCCNCLA
jgi:hypothetical protein